MPRHIPFATTVALLALLTLATATAAAAQTGGEPAEQTDPLADRVSTLELSRELDARGSLGGVTVDKLGFLYVSNFRDAVWRISPEGEVETLTRSLYGASGNAVGPRGELYQANFLGNTISRITRTGEVSTFATDGLDGPVGMAVDPEDGTVYVCNCTGHYLARVSPEGTVERFAEGERFACPNGITFGPDDALYVTNYNHHDILRVGRDGEVEVFATVPGGAGNAHLTFAKGFFYVTKIIANRVVKVSSEGEVFPVAGTGRRGQEDGPGPEATFYRPNGIAASPGGDRIYVNTVVGEHGAGEPSQIAVRVIELATLTDLLESALDEGGVEALEPAYERFSSHPVRGTEDTVAEMVALGYRLLSGRQAPAALTVFRLNAEAHPDTANAQYHLGEAYRYTGQTEEAAEQYRRTLELDPEHKLANARLEQVVDGG